MVVLQRQSQQLKTAKILSDSKFGVFLQLR